MLPWLRKLDEDGSAPTDCRNDFAVWVERWKWKSDWRGLKNRWGQGSESVCVGNFPEVSLWRRLERYGVMNRIWRCLYVFPAGYISTCLLKNPGGAQLNSLFFWLVINIGLIKIWLSDWSDLIWSKYRSSQKSPSGVISSAERIKTYTSQSLYLVSQKAVVEP